MAKPLTRSIPMAVAAGSLTFGACGNDKPSPADEAPVPTGDGGSTGDGAPLGMSSLESSLSTYAEALCAKWAECYPEDFGAGYTQADCRRYYDDYYSAYYSLVLDSAPDPEGCEEALIDAFDCYGDLANKLSCEDLACDPDFDSGCEANPCEGRWDATYEPCGFDEYYYY